MSEKSPKKDKNTRKEDKLQEQVDELTNALQRSQADFANFKRRSEEEKGQVMRAARADVIAQLLPLLDNIDRALTHIPEDLQDNVWAKGVAQVGKQAEGVLQNMQVVRIPTVGEDFDPRVHEAVAASGDGEHETVEAEMQAGYVIGDYVLRPAMVKVLRKAKK